MFAAQNFSLEATRPNPAEIASLAAVLPPGTQVYLTAVPGAEPRSPIEAAAGLRKAGLEPVAHIAARRIANTMQFDELLRGLRGEADMKRLLVIGGDIDTPGLFPDALAVIQRGALREHGFEDVDISGYPEGHP